MLYYNKLYSSLKKVSGEWHAGHIQWHFYWSYLKFYENGKFIYCSSPSLPDKMGWFNIDSPNLLYKGVYTIEKNDLIRGSYEGTMGTVTIEGTEASNDNTLILFFKNAKINYMNWEYLEIKS